MKRKGKEMRTKRKKEGRAKREDKERGNKKRSSVWFEEKESSLDYVARTK